MVSRRDFLRVGGLSVVGLSVAEQSALARFRDRASSKSCILVMMTGGASQFETFDPKPNAPPRIRGPLRAISTSVPGISISESLPRLAERAQKFAILRSLWHDAAPIHETGYQLLQTGRLAQAGRQYPSFGAVVAATCGPRNGTPPYAVIPQLLQNTGVNMYRGQRAGFLGQEYDPFTELSADENLPIETDASSLSIWNGPFSSLRFEDEPEPIRRTFGDTPFGELCWQAAQLVESGVRCVIVNLFTSLNHEITWDCHANGPEAPATLFDYRDTLCPQFDRALSGLLDDLDHRGLLDDTLVVATGEFGRTPHINERGGRDHWSGVWSGLVAGAGVRGGQVIGATDAHGAEPIERPIPLAELTATIYRTFDFDKTLLSDNGTEFPLIEAEPIHELFA